MQSRPVLRRGAAIAGAVVLAIVLAGCSFLVAYQKKASCPAGVTDRVRAALVGDPATWTDRSERPPSRPRSLLDEPQDLRLESNAGDVDATILLEPGLENIRVSVSAVNRHPDAAERARWIARADEICARLDAACPEIGEWEVVDTTQRPDVVSGLAFLGAWGAVVVGLLVWIVRRERRRRAAGLPAR